MKKPRTLDPALVKANIFETAIGIVTIGAFLAAGIAIDHVLASGGPHALRLAVVLSGALGIGSVVRDLLNAVIARPRHRLHTAAQCPACLPTTDRPTAGAR